MLHSVVAHAEGLPVHVHYLHGPGYPRRSAEAIERMLDEHGARASFVEIAPERIAGLPVDSLFTGAMWYRVFLPDLLPEVDRVLYLDVDTIAADSLLPLWEMDLSGHYLAAVTNVLMPQHRDRPAALGLTGPEVYFNSGVLLMNLDEMRANGCTVALLEYARRMGSSIEWPDQDALNVVLGRQRLPLHPRWNSMNSLRFPWSTDVFGAEAVREARARPAIRHFEGPDDNKPWHYMCTQDHAELYFLHRRATPWPRLELVGRTPRNVARRLARAGRRRAGRLRRLSA
jgi:lipopolysaccharide biosynthesis glycosyltransferase